MITHGLSVAFPIDRAWFICSVFIDRLILLFFMAYFLQVPDEPRRTWSLQPLVSDPVIQKPSAPRPLKPDLNNKEKADLIEAPVPPPSKHPFSWRCLALRCNLRNFEI